jgi:hypothetical protein
MRAGRAALAILSVALVGLCVPSGALGFGVRDFDVTFTDSTGSPSLVAGSHPFAMTTSFALETVIEEGEEKVDGAVKDLEFGQPEGLTGNLTAVPRCTTLDFLSRHCSDSTAVGITSVAFGGGVGGDAGPFPVYNLEPAPGVVGRLGFFVDEVPNTVELRLTTQPPYNAVAVLQNIPQVLEVFRAETTLWGNPADPQHDIDRGICAGPGTATCPTDAPPKPFLTLPRRCTGPLIGTLRATAWWSSSGPPLEDFEQTSTHDDAEPPNPLGTGGCPLPFAPKVDVRAGTTQAASATGLDVTVSVDDTGLTDPAGIAHSDIRKATVTLPEGVTINPSVATGLLACSPRDFARESLDSEPGQGCPEASKIGELEAETPVLEGRVLKGELFIAAQDDPTTTAPRSENPFDSLFALYLVVRDRDLGVFVKLAGEVEPDPRTGQLVTTFGEAPYELPQQPLSVVRFHLREGARSPLISPSQCGDFTTVAEFTPWDPQSGPHITTSSFRIDRGVDGGPCPPAGPLPFAPTLDAGSVHRAAGAFTPFLLRLMRRDGDQDLTHFEATLPQGLVAKLAGVSQCPDTAIAAARSNRGRAELASPSCPASSQVGTVLGGAGVGSQLTYASGALYLAGPVDGAPLSVVAIVPAVAGPFDVGTIVVRQALRVDPRTAEVRVDDVSDAIPHILAGIPLKVRDIRVAADRPQFTLNPTRCEPKGTKAQLWGAGNDLFSAVDDVPASLSAYFQVANCGRLAFKPRLSISLAGGTRRGAHPALRSIFRPRRGDANLSDLVLRLPRSAFLEQAHIGTICTRVQFAADVCPKGAVYGRAKAFTPLLDKPLAGPVYLRSSDNDLPDLVLDLHGLLDFEAVARIDSRKGAIRATFAGLPDAPIRKVLVNMRGGRKGLVVNSRGLCTGASRATVGLEAHNAKRRNLRVPVKADKCRKGRS